jgi:hypothetical protein
VFERAGLGLNIAVQYPDRLRQDRIVQVSSGARIAAPGFEEETVLAVVLGLKNGENRRQP